MLSRLVSQLKYEISRDMKRLFIPLFAAVAMVGCAEGPKIVIDDQNPTNEADVMSDSLARAVVEAQNYEQFKKARENIEAYEEAFRTQIGGEAYLVYLEACNYYLEQL